MIQQINLYQVEKKKTEFLFDFMMMLKVLGYVAALLFLVSIYEIYVHIVVSKELVLAQKKQTEVTNALTAKEGLLPSQKTRDELMSGIKKLEEERAIKQNMLQVFEQAHIQSITEYSDYFEALGRQTIPGLWLTRFSFKNNGADISLIGKALRPEYIPKFIDKLGREKAFDNKSFQVFKLVTDEKTKEIIFTLSTEWTKKNE